MTKNQTEAPAARSGLPALTDAEFRVLREEMGLTTLWLAERLKVAERTVHRWEHGQAPIPPGVVADIQSLMEHFGAQYGAWSARLLDEPEPVLAIPRTGLHDGLPAGWWRALAARIAERVVDLRVVYLPEA